MSLCERDRHTGEMRPERIELSTSGLKDRRSLGLVKTPLTTELRALTHPCVIRLCLSQGAGVLADRRGSRITIGIVRPALRR